MRLIQVLQVATICPRPMEKKNNKKNYLYETIIFYYSYHNPVLTYTTKIWKYKKKRIMY